MDPGRDFPEGKHRLGPQEKHAALGGAHLLQRLKDKPVQLSAAKHRLGPRVRTVAALPQPVPAERAPTRVSAALPQDVRGDIARHRKKPGFQAGMVHQTPRSLQQPAESLLERLLGGVFITQAAPQVRLQAVPVAGEDGLRRQAVSCKVRTRSALLV